MNVIKCKCIVDYPEVFGEGHARLPGQPGHGHLRVQLHQDIPLQVPQRVLEPRAHRSAPRDAAVSVRSAFIMPFILSLFQLSFWLFKSNTDRHIIIFKTFTLCWAEK